jgi:hypothetical protein
MTEEKEGIQPTKELLKEQANLATVFVRRVARSDFTKERATDDERKQLESTSRPVTNPLAQDYAAWRRAVLWLAAITLSILVIIELATYQDTADVLEPQQVREVGRGNLETLDSIQWILTLSLVVGAVMTVAAAWRWRDVRLSRRLARWGFLIMFLTPFAIAAIPITSMLDFGHLSEQEQKAISVLLGLQLGLGMFMTLGPRAIALFPGIIRSSMTLKTLLPESAAPGWAAAILAPLYSLFLLVLVSMINQMSGNFFLLAGLACLMVGPMVYLRRHRDVLRSHTTEEAAVLVAGIRRQALLFNVAGSVLLLIFIIDLELLGFEEAVTFALSIAGNVLLLTAVGSDLILALLRSQYVQTRQFQGTELQKSLDEKFEALAGTGLTDIRTGPQGDS